MKTDKHIETAIIHLLRKENRSMSVKEITERINTDYKIKKSPQVIKRHLLTLEEKGEISMD